MGKIKQAFARGAGTQLIKVMLGLLLLGAGGLYLVERFKDREDPEVAIARAAADSVATSERIDSLKAVWQLREQKLLETVAVIRTREAALTIRGRRLSRTVAGLRIDLSNAVTTVDTVEVLVRTVDTLDASLEVCGLRVETCLERGERLDSLYQGSVGIIEEQQAELDTLRKVTLRLVDVTNDCKYGQMNLLLVHPCNPSPTVMFFIGTAAGVGLGCFATHCLAAEPTTSITVTFPCDPGQCEVPKEPDF